MLPIVLVIVVIKLAYLSTPPSIRMRVYSMFPFKTAGISGGHDSGILNHLDSNDNIILRNYAFVDHHNDGGYAVNK